MTDVQEKDGEIVHHTEVALEVGSEVTGKIDWERRFDLMQQHSGEHIAVSYTHLDVYKRQLRGRYRKLEQKLTRR